MNSLLFFCMVTSILIIYIKTIYVTFRIIFKIMVGCKRLLLLYYTYL